MKKQKPIHKYNGGVGATLCHRCSVIISLGFTDDLYCSEECRKKHKNIKDEDEVDFIELKT